MKYTIFIILSILLLAACQSDASETNSGTKGGSTNKVAFEGKVFELLEASQTGIKFSNRLTTNFQNGHNVWDYEYFYNGAGVAIGDLDNDGLPEVFLSGNQVESKLFKNKGNFKFEDVSKKAGLKKGTFSRGVSFGDVNNDGLLDIYVCNDFPSKEKEKGAKNELYINKGNLQFEEVGTQYGVAGEHHSTQAGFLDYDKDGDLDIVVMNHAMFQDANVGKVREFLDKNPAKEPKISTMLYRNNGNSTFTDVSRQSGLINYSYGLGLVITDINQDNWPDFYIANDYSVPDFLYVNNQNGTFTDQIKNYTRQISFYGMGCDVADVNNDALPDIGVVDMASQDHIRSKTLMASMSTQGFWDLIDKMGYHYQYMFNSLQINKGNNLFANVANVSGLAKTDWSWAALFADFDNDGNKDYFISNGYRKYVGDNDFEARKAAFYKETGGEVTVQEMTDLYNSMKDGKLANLIYQNKGNLQFEDKSKDWGLGNMPSFSNGTAYGDLDGDGDLDLVVNNIDQPVFVYRNNTTNNFFRVKLNGPTSQVQNAKLTIYYGNEKQYQEYITVRGYQGCMEAAAHFGLGTQSTIDRLEIQWMDGTMQTIQNPKINQTLKVKKEENLPLANNSKQIDFYYQPVLPIKVKHTEKEYNDFEREVLLPHKQSQLGPHISVGDLNGDGLDDLYFGGAKDEAGQLYIQTPSGQFSTLGDKLLQADAKSEDLGSCFFDADGDGDMDLYVISGGNETNAKSKDLQDRLYINNNGKLSKGKLPQMRSSGQTVKAADYDKDGDMDLFVGGRAIPGQYPYPDRSYILENNKGSFRDATADLSEDLMNPGIVTDFVWTDFNKDGFQDLIVVGEWMPISFYKNKQGKSFENVTAQYGTQDKKGWWYSIAITDLDKDGDEDLIVGNLGLNNKFNPSEKKPLHIFSNDFDDSGNVDIVLSKDYKGELVPVRGRQCSSEQMPFIVDKFPTYQAFAEASIQDILGETKLEKAIHIEANDFRSMVLINNGGSYEFKPLPIEAQFSPINGIVIDDLNRDGNVDLILAGNMLHTEVETPRYDAGFGNVLMGDGKGDFKAESYMDTGFFAPFDVKDLARMRIGNTDVLLVANNNAYLQFLQKIK